jgi:hypothetical protein
LKLWRLHKIEDSIQRWSASPYPYYLGSFDINYIIFKNVELLLFFGPIKKIQRKNIDILQGIFSFFVKIKNLKINKLFIH